MTERQASRVLSEVDRVLLEGLLGGFSWSTDPIHVVDLSQRRRPKIRDVEVEVIETKSIGGGK